MLIICKIRSNALISFIAIAQELFSNKSFPCTSLLSAVARTGYMEYKGCSYQILIGVLRDTHTCPMAA